MLLLIRLEPLGIRTPLWPHRGRSDRPPVRILGGHPGLWGPTKAICGARPEGPAPRRTASPRPLLRDSDRCALIGQDLRTPRPGLAPTPPLAPPCVRGHGRRCSGGPGPPSELPRAGRCSVTRAASCAGRGSRRPSRLVSPLAGVHDQQSGVRPHRGARPRPPRVRAGQTLCPCPRRGGSGRSDQVFRARRARRGAAGPRPLTPGATAHVRAPTCSAPRAARDTAPACVSRRPYGPPQARAPLDSPTPDTASSPQELLCWHWSCQRAHPGNAGRRGVKMR